MGRATRACTGRRTRGIAASWSSAWRMAPTAPCATTGSRLPRTWPIIGVIWTWRPSLIITVLFHSPAPPLHCARLLPLFLPCVFFLGCACPPLALSLSLVSHPGPHAPHARSIPSHLCVSACCCVDAYCMSICLARRGNACMYVHASCVCLCVCLSVCVGMYVWRACVCPCVYDNVCLHLPALSWYARGWICMWMYVGVCRACERCMHCVRAL